LDITEILLKVALNTITITLTPIFRSCRQGYPIAPLIYILQKEPMACALMLNNDIQVVKLPGEGDVDSLVTKLYHSI
jgi:hypothetical protein